MSEACDTCPLRNIQEGTYVETHDAALMNLLMKGITMNLVQGGNGILTCNRIEAGQVVCSDSRELVDHIVQPVDKPE